MFSLGNNLHKMSVTIFWDISCKLSLFHQKIGVDISYLSQRIWFDISCKLSSQDNLHERSKPICILNLGYYKRLTVDISKREHPMMNRFCLPFLKETTPAEESLLQNNWIIISCKKNAFWWRSFFHQTFVKKFILTTWGWVILLLHHP